MGQASEVEWDRRCAPKGMFFGTFSIQFETNVCFAQEIDDIYSNDDDDDRDRGEMKRRQMFIYLCMKILLISGLVWFCFVLFSI